MPMTALQARFFAHGYLLTDLGNGCTAYVRTCKPRRIRETRQIRVYSSTRGDAPTDNGEHIEVCVHTGTEIGPAPCYKLDELTVTAYLDLLDLHREDPQC